MSIQQKRRIYAISGLTRSGKSYLGSRLADKINGIYKDLDDYYKEEKPKVTLSNGVTKSNWDTLESIDIVRMNKDIREIQDQRIVLSGFNLSEEVFDEDNKPDVHIHLRISKELSLVTRLETKNFNPNDRETQILMFNEVVYPYYQEILKSSKIDGIVDVEKPLVSGNQGFHEKPEVSGNRRSADELLDEIMDIIEKKLGSKP